MFVLVLILVFETMSQQAIFEHDHEYESNMRDLKVKGVEADPIPVS